MDGFEFSRLLKEQQGRSVCTIMMLTSGGQRGDAALCREIGIAAYLTKPVTVSDLYDAIVTVLGPKRDAAAPPMTRHLLREDRQSLRILLAEDNPVNQRVAASMLEKAGHSVLLAHNGLEVLELLKSHSVDLVFMDLQMPELDGLETTRKIRDREKVAGSHLPIVAMTAHALESDRLECLTIGMDDYISKPISSARLREVIAKVRSQQPAGEALLAPRIGLNS
jgi:CheY-like chemotaxis protein